MNSNMIAGIRAAEDMLAREQTKHQQTEAQKILSLLPPDHPIIQEFNSNPALVQDLGSLPPGHPVLRALMDAKARYENAIAEESEQEQEKTKERRSDSRLQKSKEEARRRAEEETDRQERKMACKTLNGQIERTTAQLGYLHESLLDISSTLESDPYCRSKLKKLERLLYASKRGLEECRLSTTRI